MKPLSDGRIIYGNVIVGRQSVLTKEFKRLLAAHKLGNEAEIYSIAGEWIRICENTGQELSTLEVTVSKGEFSPDDQAFVYAVGSEAGLGLGRIRHCCYLG